MEKNKTYITKYGQKWKAKPSKKYVFEVWMEEYERGWGSRVDQIMFFKSAGDANNYCKHYNDEFNSEEIYPDWYMKAVYRGIA